MKMSYVCTLLLTLALMLIGTHANNRGSSEPYISGDTFRSIANIVYDELNQHFNADRVKPGDIVFVKTDYLLKFINEYFPAVKHPIILIVHNSDHGIPGAISHEIFNNFLNSDNLIALFGQNVEDFVHPKLHSIPIGIANRMWDHGNPMVFTQVLKTINQNEKPYLLYMNFSPGTYPAERPYVFDLFKNRHYCTVSSPKKLGSYLHEMALHKFTLSPRGNGLDCHRTWEALLVGSIPVVRTSSLDVLYKDLPVLIIESWEQLSEQFLLGKYEEISNKKHNLAKILAAYWINKIKDLQKAYKI